jgi:hypothetical protein
MRAICRLDRPRFLAYNSADWEELIGVSASAIRQTKFWKEDRPKAIEAQASLEQG